MHWYLTSRSSSGYWDCLVRFQKICEFTKLTFKNRSSCSNLCFIPQPEDLHQYHFSDHHSNTSIRSSHVRFLQDHTVSYPHDLCDDNLYTRVPLEHVHISHERKFFVKSRIYIHNSHTGISFTQISVNMRLLQKYIGDFIITVFFVL